MESVNVSKISLGLGLIGFWTHWFLGDDLWDVMQRPAIAPRGAKDERIWANDWVMWRTGEGVTVDD